MVASFPLSVSTTSRSAEVVSKLATDWAPRTGGEIVLGVVKDWTSDHDVKAGAEFFQACPLGRFEVKPHL